MAWAERLPNGKYRAFWRDGLNRRHSKAGFTQKAAAARYAGEQENKSRRGDTTTAGRSPTWDDWRREWMTLRRVERSTMREDRSRIKNHIEPYWGQYRLGRIEREHVQAWVNSMTDSGMSAGLTRRVYHTFSASMKAAMLYKRITANPCSHIELPTPPPAQERYFTRAEFDLAVDKMNEPYRTAAILLVGTGLRFSELAALHWHRIDFDTGLITVCETWDAADGVIRPYPKSKKARYVGPVPSWVLEALTALLDSIGPDAARGGCGVSHAGVKTKCRSALVLTAQRGKRAGLPLDAKNMLRRHWKPACERAGVDVGRTHDLRHTFASWLRQAGIDLEVVQELLGHASIVTTQRYSHLGTTQHEAVRAALEGVPGPAAKQLDPDMPHDLDSPPAADAV